MLSKGRGSPDYNVKSEQWRIGDNALFLDAIALRPTKDCFRSNTSSGELFPRLQAAVPIHLLTCNPFTRMTFSAFHQYRWID